MDVKITHIVALILDEAETVKNPDRVARLYNVWMRVATGVQEVMNQIREEERNKKKEVTSNGRP